MLRNNFSANGSSSTTTTVEAINKEKILEKHDLPESQKRLILSNELLFEPDAGTTFLSEEEVNNLFTNEYEPSLKKQKTEDKLDYKFADQVEENKAIQQQADQYIINEQHKLLNILIHEHFRQSKEMEEIKSMISDLTQHFQKLQMQQK